MEKKTLKLQMMIPSLFTVCAFLFGLNGIRLAILGDIKGAIFSIGVSAVLDLIDGRVARMLMANSQFGAELDSLSDVVCFGVAPAFIVLFAQDFYNNFLYLGASFFAVGSLLRLARFNVVQDYPEYYNDFFVGVPTPAGCIIALLPLSFGNAFDILINSTFYSIYLIFIGFLMISNIPTLLPKSIHVSKKFIPFLFLTD